MRKYYAAAFVFLSLIGVVWYARARAPEAQVCDTNPALATTAVSGNGSSVQAEVATAGEDQVRGLSGRNCLGEGRAMLFPYDLPGDYCFWMKDMRFSIDMIWLDEEKKIVTVRDKVKPDSYPASFCPERPARYVLEVEAGAAEAYGWGVGTALAF